MVKINYFILKPLSAIQNVGKIFIAKPSLEKEKLYGRLFGFASVDCTTELKMDFIQLIIEEMKNNFYYNQENESRAMATKKINAGDYPENVALEHALKKTNNAISRFLGSDGPNYDLQSMQAILVAIKESEITLSV